MFSITGYWESLQSHVELVGNQLVTGGGSICLQAIFRAIGSFLAFASYKAKNFYFPIERTFIWQSAGKSLSNRNSDLQYVEYMIGSINSEH